MPHLFQGAQFALSKVIGCCTRRYTMVQGDQS
jgi:hypothetical protein